MTYFFVAQNERGDATGTGALAGSCAHVNEPSVFMKRGEHSTIQILAFDSQDVLCPKCLLGTSSLRYNTELLRLWEAKEADQSYYDGKLGGGGVGARCLPCHKQLCLPSHVALSVFSRSTSSFRHFSPTHAVDPTPLPRCHLITEPMYYIIIIITYTRS